MTQPPMPAQVPHYLEEVPPTADLLGVHLGAGYQIRKVVGEGGMGQVFLAVNDRLGGREAAVKVLLPEFANRIDALNRFLGEAKAAAALNDPNIVDVFDAGAFVDGRPFIMMAYVNGGSVEDLCEKRGPLPLDLAFTIIVQVAAALHTAHSFTPPIVHRDVKPQNVLLQQRKGRPIHAILTDFGIAKLGDFAGNMHTGTQKIMGSPGYMAPEIVTGAGAKDADPRADVYALATMLYRMVCGVRPYMDDSVYVLISKLVTNESFPRPIQHRPNLPPAWDEIIMHGLAADREQRIGTVKEFAHRLAKATPDGEAMLTYLAPRLVDTFANASDATISDSFGAALAAWTTQTTTNGKTKRKLPWAWMTGAALGGLAVGAMAMVALAARKPALDAHAVASVPDASLVAATSAEVTPPPGPSPGAVPPAAAVPSAAVAALAQPAPAAAAPTSATPSPPQVTEVAPQVGAAAPQGGAMPAPVPTAVAAPVPTAVAAPVAPAAAVQALPKPSDKSRSRSSRGARDEKPPAVEVAKGEGLLLVLAKPWAEVFIDGKAAGNTPVNRKLAAGRHRLTLVNEDRKESKVVTIEADQTLRIDHKW